MNSLARGLVAKQDRVAPAQKLFYGMGALAGQFAGNITTSMFNPVFNIALGVSPAIIGGVLMLYRIWDAVCDIVVGNISDNVRTRWGRRRPLIVVGGLLTGFLVPLLWQASPSWSMSWKIAYMVIMGLMLFSAMSVWAMPYYSLGMEMSPDYNERTRITAVRAVFEKLAGIIGGWMLALVALPYFGNPATGEPDLAKGMQFVSWGLGAVVAVVAVLPGIFVKERYYEKESKEQKKIGIIYGLKTTLQCRPFIILMAVYLLQIIGSTMVGTLGFYLNIYYINGGDLQKAGIIQGLKSTATLVPGILSVPLWAWISEKIGKKRALGMTILLGFVANLLVYFCYTPRFPYLQIVPAIFLSAFGSAIWMIVPSMLADVVDYDELHTFERREGSFSSVSSWFFKLSTTLTTGLSGLIITWTGFDVVRFGKSQPPEALQRMLLWYVFLPMIFWTIALVLLRGYELTRERMGEIRNDLEERRGTV